MNLVFIRGVWHDSMVAHAGGCLLIVARRPEAAEPLVNHGVDRPIAEKSDDGVSGPGNPS